MLTQINYSKVRGGSQDDPSAWFDAEPAGGASPPSQVLSGWTGPRKAARWPREFHASSDVEASMERWALFRVTYF